MAKELEKLTGGLTKVQFTALKKKHGKIYLIEVIDPTTKETKYFWFKKPDMKVLSVSAKYSDDPFKMGEIMFQNCLIEGDREAKNDVDVFPAIVAELSATIKSAKATLKEF